MIDVPLHAFVHADPWAQDLVDLASLNARASDAISDSIASVRLEAQQAPATMRGRSIVVLGPAGAGKTHLFARLRRKLGPRAVFVHVRPLIGAEMTPRYLLREIVAQLGFETHGLRQVDALVGSLVGHLEGRGATMPRAFIEMLASVTENARNERLEEVIEQVVDLWPHVDDVYLRKLLHTPFAKPIERRALLAWLSGREPDESQLARIGAREGLRDDLVMPALKTLGAVAAPGAPIVVVFDQLENLVDTEGANRVRAYGNLVAELVDEVRGVVLVQMALDTEWARAIEPELATSQRTRAAMHRQTLELPSASQREELLRLWVARLPGEFLFPAPFGKERVDAWQAELGLTPRQLLLKCVAALEGAPLESSSLDEPHEDSDPSEAVEQAWNRHLERARSAIDEASRDDRCMEAEDLADGFAAAIRFVDGLRVASVRHTRPAQLVIERGADQVHVAVIARTHARSVAACMDGIARVAERDLVLVVRELAHAFPPTWKRSIERREALLKMQRVHWLDLARDELARLLALRALVADARSRDVADLEGRPLDEESVWRWIESKLDVPAWTSLQLLATLATKPIAIPVGIQSPDTREPDGPPSAPPSAPKKPTRRIAGAGAIEVLLRLRVASVDRIAREVSRMHASATRADVLAELQAVPSIRWFGRTVVAWQEDEP